jgi:protein TonB
MSTHASLPTSAGRGLIVALLAHAIVLTPLVVSVVHFERRPVDAPEAAGLTFIDAPLRGIGSPPPSAMQDHRAGERAAQGPTNRETPREPATPAVPDVSTAVIPAPPAPSSAPIIAPSRIDVPPASIPSGAIAEIGVAAQSGVAAPQIAAGAGVGGHGETPPPPAIGAPGGTSNWSGLVLGRLEQFRRYPAEARRSRQEGVCYVRFTIDRQGHVLASSLDRTSGYALLDREAVALVRRADPLPAPPAEIEGETISLTVPVEFFLSDPRSRPPPGPG